ncbi:MAG: thioredoxin family protein [Gammaproteobacteria bacterium]|nr:thioredoxin family protein [Gammaproteobacteria bacterium]
MNKKPIDIEVFTSTVCNHCQRASRMVEQLLKEPGFESITWREIDVVAEIDLAVTFCVLATPSIAIGGALVFTALPSRQQLRNAIQHYLLHERPNDA